MRQFAALLLDNGSSIKYHAPHLEEGIGDLKELSLYNKNEKQPLMR
jgi:hypothetical protein